MMGPTYLLSSSVAPSIFFRTSSVSSESFSNVISSLGFSDPKTSLTAAVTLCMSCMQPRCSNHQLKDRYRRLVSKSLPYACSKLSSSLFSRLIFVSEEDGAASDTTLAR
jgi:hypothetical protein